MAPDTGLKIFPRSALGLRKIATMLRTGGRYGYSASGLEGILERVLSKDG